MLLITDKTLGRTNTELITKYNLGSLLVGGDGCPDNQGNLQISDNPDYFKATMTNW
jgi:hypothetical protein